MLQHDGMTSELGALLPADIEAARAVLDRDLSATLRPARDYYEDRIDLLRHWVSQLRVRISEQWLLGLIDGTQAAQYYSILAESVIAAMLPQVTTTLAHTQGRLLTGRFVVVAMGKLGSREMTVQSDLDLVFIYDAPKTAEDTDGPEPAPLTAYYTKLSQKLIAALMVMTGKGALFDVDMRLRPFGDSGPIASSLTAFRRYFEQDAWTWEYMALTRARVIAGDPDLGARVTAEIAAILAKPRSRDKILTDVSEMRNRIARQHPSTILWDCKYRRGGLVDIEFIVQAYQLIHAAEAPEILACSTKDALRRLGQHGFLPRGAAQELEESFSFWQDLQGLVRVSQDRSGDSRVTPDLFDRVLLDLTGLEDHDARAARADQASAIAKRHYDELIDGSHLVGESP